MGSNPETKHELLSLEDPQQSHKQGDGKSASWTPGRNCFGFCSRGHSFDVQTQVLLTNAVEVCIQLSKQKRLPAEGVSKSQRLRALASCSGVELLRELRRRIRNQDCNTKSCRLVDYVVGGLTCLPPSTIRFVWRSCWEGGTPEPKQRSQRGRHATAVSADALNTGGSSGKEIMQRNVRIALANATLARPRSDYCHDVLQLQLAGISAGHKYLNRKFPVVVETVASRVLSSALSTLCSTPMSGLGIPSESLPRPPPSCHVIFC